MQLCSTLPSLVMQNVTPVKLYSDDPLSAFIQATAVWHRFAGFLRRRIKFYVQIVVGAINFVLYIS